MVSPRNANGVDISQLAIVSKPGKKQIWDATMVIPHYIFCADSDSDKNSMGYDTRSAV